MHSQKKRGNGIIGKMGNHPGSRAHVREPFISLHPKPGPELPHYCSPLQDTTPSLWYANNGCGLVEAGKRAEAFRWLTHYKAANFKAQFKRFCSHPAKSVCFLQCWIENPNKLEWNLKQWSRPNSEIRNQSMLSTWLLSVLRTLIISRW